jgi:hypothetical protein
MDREGGIATLKAPVYDQYGKWGVSTVEERHGRELG